MTDKKKSGKDSIRARLEQAAIDRRQQDEASMISRGIYLSDNERADLQAIDDKYSPLLDAALQEEQAASATRPDVNAFYQGISPERNPDEWQAAQKRAAAAIRAWEADAPQAWKDARDQLDNLYSKRNKEASGVYRAAYDRQYKELGNDPAEITRRAKEQISRLVTDQYNHYKELSEKALSMSAYDLVALGGKDWKLDAAETRKRILEALKPLHFKALDDNIAAIEEIKAYIEKALLDSPYIAKEGTPGTNTTVIFKERPKAEAIEITRTIYPNVALSLIDKVSKTAFAGELTEQLQPLKAERRGSLKKIDTFASINFNAPELKDLKALNLGHYEKAVMDAIITLYIVGNEYMTLQMIYQTMRGDSEARLSPVQAKDLSDCITKFMYGGIKIDATQEGKAYKLPGSLIYDTNLLHIERVTHNLNGTNTECIHIIKTPVLYEYANSKNQIGRVPILTIATPIDKNKETISLQSFLLERVLGMRGGDPQHDIAYSTIYSIVWGEESASKGTQGSYIRVKRSRLKKKIFSILNHWTADGTAKDGGALIKGHEEYPHGKNARGIRIIL